MKCIEYDIIISHVLLFSHRIPIAHVKCDFQSLENATKTIVEHNLPSQFDVRSRGEVDFSINITYREFSPEMLQELISHSLYCTQYIKYDCLKAPLDLNSATWFTSSDENNPVDFVGDAKRYGYILFAYVAQPTNNNRSLFSIFFFTRIIDSGFLLNRDRGSCTCANNQTCEEPHQSCNCDANANKWFSDEGYYSGTQSLGITNMYFLQQKDLDEDSKGRMTLGPLECVETSESYIKKAIFAYNVHIVTLI